MGKSITKYLLQVILIVFSVVLGLYLSERIEDRKNEKDAAKLLSKINSELNRNKKMLDHWVSYHGEILNAMDSLTNDENFIKNFIDDESAIYEAFSRGTIMSDMPSNDALDIAKSHPLIVNIDYDILLSLSKVFNQQKITYEPIPKLIDLLLSSEFNASETAKPNLKLFINKLNDVYSRELQLIDYYNEADEILKFQN